MQKHVVLYSTAVSKGITPSTKPHSASKSRLVGGVSWGAGSDCLSCEPECHTAKQNFRMLPTPRRGRIRRGPRSGLRRETPLRRRDGGWPSPRGLKPQHCPTSSKAASPCAAGLPLLTDLIQVTLVVHTVVLSHAHVTLMREELGGDKCHKKLVSRRRR